MVFDWFSCDLQEVDRYVVDLLCGFCCSNQLWMDLFGGLVDIILFIYLWQIDVGLLLMVIGGECDLVSQGRCLGDLVDVLCGVGLCQVILKIYFEVCYELFNESNCDVVI